MSLTVVLSRLISQGRVAKLRKGVYYIPGQREFYGIPRPDKGEILKYLCRRTNGYISGYSSYNMMGLTEQVPNVIVIASRNFTPGLLIFDKRRVIIKKAYCCPNARNVEVLRILDALTNIKNIPGKSPAQSYKNLISIIAGLNYGLLITMCNCVLSYPPRTRYLCAKMLEYLGHENLASNVICSINSSTLRGYEYSALIPRN